MKSKIISVHSYTHCVRQSLLSLLYDGVECIRDPQLTYIIQPGSMKLSPQLYLYVYIKCYIDIFELKYRIIVNWSVLAKDPNLISEK